MRRLMILSGAAAVLLLAGSAGAATAGTFPVRICGANARDPGDGLTWSSTGLLVAAPPACPAPGSGGFDLVAGPNEKFGYNATAAYKVTAPAGLTVYSIHVVGAGSSGIGSNGWWGEFYWNGGPGPAGSSGPLNDAQFAAGGCCSQANLHSGTIGWFIACNQPTCSTGGPGGGVQRDMTELDLTAEEDRGPLMIPTAGGSSLWVHPGWVRGSWDASIAGNDPSGVCGGFVTLGSLGAATVAHPTLPVRSRWQQCPEQGVSTIVDTSISQGSLGLGVGTMPLTAGTDNAAAVHSGSAKMVMVDNSTPTVSISGPTDAPSTAGTQYVTATGAAGPSGIADILCTVDGGAQLRLAGPSAQVPVAGIGQHTVSCRAEDNAVDPVGNHGTSAPASYSVKIGQPTLIGISFNKLVGLRCHRMRERVSVGGRVVTVRRHGKLVTIHRGGRSKLIKVMRCHPRTALRRTVVSVTVRHHGHLVKLRRVRFVRVVVPPHAVTKTARRVPFGHGTTVNGWLGTANGNALVGQTVRVLNAPDNGMGHFSQAAVVTTSASGSWRAKLPAGPSRLVEAIYDGGPTTETTSSTAVHLAVPAMVRIHVHPTVVPWGSHLRITGRVLGGYIPPHSNVLRLLFGDGPRPHTIGNPKIRRDGRFLIPISWSAGRGVVNYWFAVATLAEADYPYARGVSRRVVVTVGLRR